MSSHRGAAGYGLMAPVEKLDLLSFRRAAREGRVQLRLGAIQQAAAAFSGALDLWPGSATLEPGLPGGRLVAALADLEDQRAAVVEDLARVRLALGEAGCVVVDMAEHTLWHPLREPGWEVLMQARYLCNDTPGALAAFERLRRILRAELGIDPHPSVQRLRLAILRGESISSFVTSSSGSIARPPDVATEGRDMRTTCGLDGG
ncbi:AfsR/SARP family transcriptional regulator [Micromonospora narathiwatensis]|uniref:AfsR/SARP family transcriptional regulator n=1 Tax=Micromonospora narathiwatensis TaxID=299146 RepID=UPI00143057A7|nr:AfsR/SARP family transcriptional regulator [Micromonospora narathiwatensis]